MGIELFAFGCGWFQAPKPFFGRDDGAEVIVAPVPAYLIRHPTHGLAVFDTGIGHRFRLAADAVLPPEQVGFDFREGDELAARLRAADIDPAAVRWVINSHLHPDHCGGNAFFSNATVVIQRRELEAARHNEDGYMYDPVDFDLGQPLLEIDGEHDLFGDGTLVLFPTYGHTPGHQSARVKLASGDVVLTADCCYMEHNLDHLGIPAINKDKEASLDVLRRLRVMRDNGTRILFGHDPDQWQRVPHGRPII
jgi:glyoxylase-like metal-dependent hydrolase (beta-lactamase superfamily II)